MTSHLLSIRHCPRKQSTSQALSFFPLQKSNPRPGSHRLLVDNVVEQMLTFNLCFNKDNLINEDN